MMKSCTNASADAINDFTNSAWTRRPSSALKGSKSGMRWKFLWGSRKGGSWRGRRNRANETGTRSNRGSWRRRRSSRISDRQIAGGIKDAWKTRCQANLCHARLKKARAQRTPTLCGRRRGWRRRMCCLGNCSSRRRWCHNNQKIWSLLMLMKLVMWRSLVK